MIKFATFQDFNLTLFIHLFSKTLSSHSDLLNREYTIIVLARRGPQKPSISWQEKLQHGVGLDDVDLGALAAFTAVDSDDDDDNSAAVAAGMSGKVKQAGTHLSAGTC